MNNEKQDWPHEILRHLYENYSPFDVYINDFLKKRFDLKSTDGNRGRKVVRILNELKERKLITWEHTDHKNENIILNPDPNDNTSVTLQQYRFHTRLTIEGLDYIGNYLRIEKQERFTRWSLISSGLATIFIIITTVKSCTDNPNQEIRLLDNHLQESIHRLDSLRKTQEQINNTLEKMIKAKQENQIEITDFKKNKKK